MDKTDVKNKSKVEHNNLSPTKISKKLLEYNLDAYIKDVENEGLEKTWNVICDYALNNGEHNSFIRIENFAEMYEIGLAIEDKIQKKKNGQYYTPDDIALVMSKWLDKCKGENICDVACGTGKLILTYLDYIGKKKAKKLLSEGKLYLYDYDKVALKICKTSLLIKYGMELDNLIHDINYDFLDSNIVLPDNCKTISNPPYAGMKEIGKNWIITDVVKDSKEWYSAFMEKIFDQSVSTVIITPFSFISGSKFYSLRKKMCELGNGYIVAFDNVPGNVFCGRKQGIFNTNTANSVRAAITVFSQSKTKKGFRISPLIRFKNEERNELLRCEVLESVINDDIQIVNDANKSFKKISIELKDIYDSWITKSKFTVKDLISKDKGSYLIDMPNTCRYNTTASSEKLNRGGSITMRVENEDVFYFLYCFFNSSFTYWWWRIYDGGITYPVSLLNKMPIPYNLVRENEKKQFKKIALEMIENEKKYISTKVNAGLVQENIKFPKKYRDMINSKILKMLEYNKNTNVFNSIHANKFFIDNSDVDFLERDEINE